jgi:large subunit ribosomal protein L5
MSSLTSSPRTLPRHCLCKWSPSPTIGKRTLVSRLSPRHRPSALQLGPASPHFSPRKWGQTTRLSMYYDNVVAPDYLVMAYDPTAKRPKQILPLRWDGTSPYHKNRPQPREPQPKQIRYPIQVKTLPKVKSITVHTMMKSALVRNTDVLNAAQAFQSITGLRPTFIRSKSNMQVFKLRSGISQPGGESLIVKVLLLQSRFSFKVLTCWLSFLPSPRLCSLESPILKAFISTGMKGRVPSTLDSKAPSLPSSPKSQVPTLSPNIRSNCLANFDSFSPLPGFDISIATTAVTSADARLLLSAYGIPFKKGHRKVPKKPKYHVASSGKKQIMPKGKK